jgi:hypothetical protein
MLSISKLFDDQETDGDIAELRYAVYLNWDIFLSAILQKVWGFQVCEMSHQIMERRIDTRVPERVSL